MKHRTISLRKFIAILLLCLFASPKIVAQRLVKEFVFSKKMEKTIDCNVILPNNYDLKSSQRFPVIYLLHGYDGYADSWIEIAPQLSERATQLELIFVLPNGKNSWYFDSPQQPESQYETFVAQELVDYIDQKYRTINSRKARAISGFSMGGHGAMWIALNRKERFGTAGTTSGAMDFLVFADGYDLKEVLGEKTRFPQRWQEHTIYKKIESVKDGELKLIIDCGIQDFLLPWNRALHQKMIDLGISHDYIERPGEHNDVYWRNAIDYQILFFHKFFEKETE